jgi:hypothetical protein
MTSFDSAKRAGFLESNTVVARLARFILRLIIATAALTKLVQSNGDKTLRLRQRRAEDRDDVSGNPWAWGP